MPSTVKFSAKIGKGLESLPDRVIAGVKATGAAARYALVWELGAAWLEAPGPKTMRSTNMLGEDTILTIQAPRGYVRINRQKYLEFLQEEFSRISFKDQDTQQRTKTIKELTVRVANRCLTLIRDTVPVDTGQLRDSLQVILPGDQLLRETPGDRELAGI